MMSFMTAICVITTIIMMDQCTDINFTSISADHCPCFEFSFEIL